MTGVEFYEYLNQSIDKNYSEYLQEDEANRLINTCMYNLTEKIYRANFTQKTYDEIDNLIVTELPATVRADVLNLFDYQIDNVTVAAPLVTVTTVRRHFLEPGDSVTIAGVQGAVVTNINGTFAIATVPSPTTFVYSSVGAVLTTYTDNSGTVATASTLPNYYHLLALRSNFPSGISKSVTGAISGSATKFTIVKHGFRNGDIINVTGVGGISGTFTGVTVTVINKNTISVNAASSGTYTSGGTATLVVSEYAKPYSSDLKASPLYTPTYLDPRYEMAEGYTKLYPSGSTTAVVDYIRTPPVTIDVEDNIIDLNLWFNSKFLFRLVDECTVEFAGYARDENRMQTAYQDTVINP